MPVCLSEICREEMGLVLVEFGELNLSCSLFERRKVYTVGIPTSNLCIFLLYYPCIAAYILFFHGPYFMLSYSIFLVQV